MSEDDPQVPPIPHLDVRLTGVRTMGLAINLFGRSTCPLDPVQIVVYDHAHHIIKRPDRYVAARLAPPASRASHHSKQVRGVLELIEAC